MKKTIEWYENPTKKTLIIFGLIWFIGASLMILGLTDLFRESILKIEYLIPGLLWLSATNTIIKLYQRYFNNKKVNKTE